ncbi:hypothetical protein A9266_20005 [Vibrio tasmaniensis]|nr:hypothetical protein A9266_20005 [Vibrio tasmaniensis]
MILSMSQLKNLDAKLATLLTCVSNNLSLDELEQPEHIHLSLISNSIKEQLYSIDNDSTIESTYGLMISVQEDVERLISFCKKNDYESHAFVQEAATFLQEYVQQLLNELTPKAILHAIQKNSPDFEKLDVLYAKAQNKISELSSLQQSIENSASNLEDFRKEHKEEQFEMSNQLLRTQAEALSEIKKETSISTNRILSFTDNFVDDVNYKLSDIEQGSIKRMAEHSSERLEALKEVQNGALNHFNGAVDDKIDHIASRIENEVKKFDSRRSDMDDLLEKVGLAKDADVTISQANAEEAIANQLRTRGLIAMYCSIVVLVFFFADYIGISELWGGTSDKTLSDLTLEAFAIRFMTVLLLSSPAIYMLKESAVHRAKENLYRQRGTQLLTIRGYLSDLPDKERTEVKQDLAKNFFSFHDGKTDTSNVPDFLKDMKEAVGIAKSLNGQNKTVSQRFGRQPKQ